MRKAEGGAVTYYLRSAVLGGRVVCEVGGAGGWQRGYVYLGAQLLAVQQGGAVSFVHEDPVTKSKRVTDMTGAPVSAVESDPFGADTTRSSNAAFQPRKYTTYERDANGSDEATFRRYHGRHARFSQPDPYDGSYDLADPQSLNRYAYTQNDPVNFVDPSGLDLIDIGRFDGGTIIGQVDSAVRGGTLSTLAGLMGRDGSVLDESAPGEVEGGTPGPAPQQDPARQENKDCYAFADEVAKIAADSSLHWGFLGKFADALRDRFAPEGYRVANREFGSDGFKREFRDTTPSEPGGTDFTPNQARHYVGGFRAVVHGGPPGASFMNYRERPGRTPSQKADLALNVVSKRHAEILTKNTKKISELADMIRRDVCEPRP